MPKYIVTTRMAAILDADSPESAKDYFDSLQWEISGSFDTIFDTYNETQAKELFDA